MKLLNLYKMNILVFTIAVVCRLTLASAGELRDDSFWCPANERPLFKIQETIVSDKNLKKLLDEADLADSNRESKKNHQRKIVKDVPWIVAEILIRKGMINKIELPPPDEKKTVLFGRSSINYVSIVPDGVNVFDIARQVDPCNTFIVIPIID